MDKQMQGLLAQANPQLARLLDEQERQKAQQARMQGANYGNDAMGRFLSAYSGAARSATEGGRTLANNVMGNERGIGVREQAAVQAQAKEEAALLKDKQEVQQVNAIVGTDLGKESEIESLDKKISILGQIGAVNPKAIAAMEKLQEQRSKIMDREVKARTTVNLDDKVIIVDGQGNTIREFDKTVKGKDITGTIQAINASTIPKDQKASLIRLTASGDISSSDALKSINDSVKEAREAAGKWKSTGGDGSTVINDVTGETRSITQINTGRDTTLTQDKIAKLYEKFTHESISDFIDNPRARLVQINPGKKDTFDYNEANNLATELNRKSTSLSNLAYRIGEADLTAGFRGKVTEYIKQVAGTQDIETAIRKEYDLVVKSGMLKYLPPGVASDKDVALVLQGLPDTFTDGETARRYIMGLAKLQRQQAKYQQERISYAKDNSGDMSGFLDGQKNKAMQEYRGSFEQLATADPNVQKAYDNAKYLLSLGIDPVEVEQRTFGLFADYPELGFRNASLVNELIKLEGY
jgi:hypothetical protein